MKEIWNRIKSFFRNQAAAEHQSYFFEEHVEKNLQFMLIIAVLLTVLPAIDLVKLYNPGAAGQVYSKVNATAVYTVLFLFNLAFAILFGLALRDRRGILTRATFKHSLMVAFRIGDMFLASFTFLSTEKGSSFFFEYLLISMLIYLLPFYSIKETIANALANLIPAIAILNYVGYTLAWQDWTDMIVFHAFCILISQRRWNMHVSNELDNLQRQNRLSSEARTDGLTLLANRNALRDDFPDFVGQKLCVALIDLDSFKQINDTYGHLYGDQVLKFVSKNLRQSFNRPGDYCYRYGGDELLIISAESDLAAFRDRLARFQDACQKPVLGHQIFLSIGYALGSADSEADVRKLLKLADSWLYEVKNTGKARIAGGASQAAGGQENYASMLASLMSFDDLTAFFNLHRDAEDWTLVYLDVLHFAEINEEFGYRQGHQLLEQIAEIIKDEFPRDPVANVDTDRFIIYGTSSHQEVINHVLAIQQKAAGLLPHRTLIFRAGLYYRPQNSDTEFLTEVNCAKYACESDREFGQDSRYFHFYGEEMRQVKEQREFVTANFDQALKEKRIVPYYQPFLGVLSEKTAGFEALARWQDPQKGLMLPEDFVPYLESTQESYKLDLYMLEAVCQDLSQHPALLQKGLSVTVNLSRTDFSLVKMPEAIDQIVSRYQIPKEALQLEITESAVSDNNDVQRAIRELKWRGYRLWLDNFGTGESSISSLKENQFDGIKLSPKLFDGFQKDERTHLIIRSILDLCHQIGVLTVAVGIDGEQKYWYARQWGVSFVQGHYFSPALPLAELLKSRYVQKDHIRDAATYAYCHPMASVNLDQAMEQEFYGDQMPEMLFGKAVIEKQGDHLYFLRLNRPLHLLLQGQLNEKDIRMELVGDQRLKARLLEEMVLANQQPGVQDFLLRIAGQEYHCQLAELVKERDKAGYVLSLSNFGVANPVEKSG